MRVIDHEVAALELVQRRAEEWALADEPLGTAAAPRPILLLLTPVVVPDVHAGDYRRRRERWLLGYGPSRVRRRMPRRFWTARSSSPSFFAAQMNAQTTTASVNTLTAVIAIPRKVLTVAV